MMRACAVVVALLAFTAGAARAQTYAGVVEDDFGGVFPQVLTPILRVAFVRDDSGWRAADSPASHGIWTIGFDGRAIGQFSRGQSFDAARTPGLVDIANSRTIPRIGEPREEFAGWHGVPVHRPLMATTSGHVEDPAHWRRHPLHADALRAVRHGFRARFPQVDNCADPNENKARPWRFAESALEAVSAYAADDGWQIATLRLAGYNCDGPIDDPREPNPFADQVFAISPSGEAQFLSEGMWLIDAGDYDDNGKSELIFAINRYNEGGYELFSDDFRTHVLFSFAYH